MPDRTNKKKTEPKRHKVLFRADRAIPGEILKMYEPKNTLSKSSTQTQKVTGSQRANLGQSSMTPTEWGASEDSSSNSEAGSELRYMNPKDDPVAWLAWRKSDAGKKVVAEREQASREAYFANLETDNIA